MKNISAKMFILPEETGQRIEQALAQRVCTSIDGSYIRRSYGRIKAGRLTKYTVHMASGQTFVIRAYNDNMAIEKANNKIVTQSLKIINKKPVCCHRPIYDTDGEPHCLVCGY